jgi:hypothetical protein
MTVEFTEDEVRVLLALLDVAVKAAGLQAAESALVIARKLQPPPAE